MWENVVWLLVAFGIAGAIKIVYEEIAYKKNIPIESMKTEWQVVNPKTTMTFDGRIYTGEVYLDKLSIKKEGERITVWMKVKPNETVVQQRGKQTVRWNEGIYRWIIDCRVKEIKMDYFSLYWDGKKQLSGKMDDFQLPVMKDTLSYVMYELFCF